jgi:hypothetical protein
MIFKPPFEGGLDEPPDRLTARFGSAEIIDSRRMSQRAMAKSV